MSGPMTPVGQTSFFSPAKMALLLGAVLALFVASVFSFVELGQLRRDLNLVRADADQARKEVAEAREQLSAELNQFRENANVSTLSSRNTIDSLKAEIEATRRQARSVLGSAQQDANKKLEELERKLAKAQQEQAQRVAAVNEAVSQVRSDNDATRATVGVVSKEVSEVRSSVDATKSELEKTIEALKSTKGDLGYQSGLIATNARELAALKAQGERTFLDFRLQKEKAPEHVGSLRIRLKTADPKKNRYTVEVMADDKLIEKKDKTINEPVQFLLSGSSVPYEMVVNEVKKDLIVGYVSEPTAKQGRK